MHDSLEAAIHEWHKENIARIGENAALQKRIAALEEVLRDIALHTDPNAQNGAYRFDSAHDACDFAHRQALQALKGEG